ELQRLHYRRAERPERPGTYRVQGARFDIALRPARFADETRNAQLLNIVAGPQGLESVRDSAGRDVPVLRLEPLLIGSIFPIHGEDRIVVTPQEVPTLLPAALKAVEDRKFDSHHGVDPIAMLRALWVDVRARQIEQGGSTLTQVDLSWLALLVAVVRGPSYYDPRRHPERARARRDLVLKIMADQGIVTAREASAAAHQALGVSSRPAGAYYPAYLDFVRRTLRRDHHDQDLTEAGLRIYTSLEPRAQEQAEQALDHELARLDRQRKHAQEPLEGAIVVTSPQSGDVIAIVGGRNVGYDGFDRALDAHRSMGSLVKPFIYLTALESGHYNAATVVQDAPIDVALAKDKHWRPENFTHQTYGPVPVVRALAESLNLATVGVGLDVGLPK